MAIIGFILYVYDRIHRIWLLSDPSYMFIIGFILYVYIGFILYNTDPMQFRVSSFIFNGYQWIYLLWLYKY